MAVGLNTSIARRAGISRAGVSTQSRLVGRVRVLGIPEALAKLERVGQVVFRDLGLITYRTALAIEKSAKANIAPHRHSGNLEDGIRAQKRGVYSWVVEASSRAGGSNREYAAHVERGTRYMQPIPYLRPAFNEHVPTAQAQLMVLAMKLERI